MFYDEILRWPIPVLESALETAKRSVELQGAYYNWDTPAAVYQKMSLYEDALKTAEKACDLADDGMKTRYKAKLDQIKKEMEGENGKK